VRALLCGSIPPEWGGATGGGVATFHRIFIEELYGRSDAHDVEIAGLIPFNLDPASPHRAPVHMLLPEDGASEIDFYAHALEASGADVVVFQHITNRWAVYHARLKPPTPAMGVVHSWHPVTFKAGEAAERSRKSADEALGGLDRLVCCSAHVRTEGERLGFAYPVEADVIHYPLQPAFMADLDVVGQRRRGLIFVGSVIDRKNPMAVVEAAVRCDADLTVVGEGPGEPGLRSAAARLGFQDRVTFVGWLPVEPLRGLLLRAEMLCLPSRSEGFSVAYLEAIACGTPIVGMGANVDELSERLGLRCGASVRDGTVDEVVAAVRWVRRADWDRGELRRRAVGAFSPKRVVSAYAAILRDMAARGRGAGFPGRFARIRRR
jgi:glycosyltransferase involved in cell wall biosynthesis